MQQQDTIVFRNGLEKDVDAMFEMYWIAALGRTKHSDEFSVLKSKEQCKGPIIDRQREYLKNNDFVFLVAEENDKIVGIATGHKRKRDESELYLIETIGYVNTVCVHPEYQKSDIGKKLLERLLEELYQKGLDCVEVCVPYKDTSIDVYSSLGFIHTNVMMLKGKTMQKTTEKIDMGEGNGSIRHNPYGRGKATIPFIVKVKPVSVMGEYIALHGLVPQNELPEHLRHQIPEDEIWIREDIYEDPIRREQVLYGHEKFELGLMETKGLTYKQAHRIAELHEQVYKIEEELAHMENEMRITPYEPVRLIVETPDSKTKKNEDAEKMKDTPINPQK